VKGDPRAGCARRAAAGADPGIALFPPLHAHRGVAPAVGVRGQRHRPPGVAPRQKEQEGERAGSNSRRGHIVVGVGSARLGSNLTDDRDLG
jgi:hypothetical protein